MIRTMESDTADLLYNNVANDIATMIQSGTLTPGERVPSVRRLSRQRRMSITTVLRAYAVLENRGLIEARPQSGYYVRGMSRVLEEPTLTKPPRASRLVGVHALVSRVLEDRRWPDLIPFGATIPHPDLIPINKLRRILNTIGRTRPRSLGTYSFPPGQEELRRQIALHARDYGVNVNSEEIIITNGCTEAINLCLRAVAKSGDVVALESPTYFGLLQIIESLGMKALEIPTHPRDGISLEALELAIERERVKACLMMPTVSNPLGSSMSEAAKRRLVKLLAQHEIPLIEDAIYSELEFGDRSAYAAKAFDKNGMVILCSSFSKTFAPGFRVGWVTPGRFHAQIQMLKFVSSVGVPDLLQLTVAEYLNSGGYDRLLRTLRRTYSDQVETIQHAVYRSFPGKTKITRPGGGFFLWVEMPEGVDSVELYEQAVNEGIGIAPGPMFSASNRYRNCMRLNCGVPLSDRNARALARLGELVHRQLE